MKPIFQTAAVLLLGGLAGVLHGGAARPAMAPPAAQPGDAGAQEVGAPAPAPSTAQEDPRSLMLAFSKATITRWPDGRFVAPGAPWRWNYELGVLLEGMDAAWKVSGDPEDYGYIRDSMDPFLSPNGTIFTYKEDERQLDNILPGRQLLLLYGTTHDPRYATAAAVLYRQLKRQPRTRSGGFWHKQRYPNQMWLDGLYMAEPFYAQYASMFHHPRAFADITHQFVLMRQHAYDPATGLLFHGWDESKRQRWANSKTGTSSQIWARGVGWYLMALVDTLPYLPANDPGRETLLRILRREAAAVNRYQSAGSGLWYQVMDKAGAPGNYPESSASCMFVYALAKGVRLGYLPRQDLAAAERGYQGIVRRFVKVGADGSMNLTGTVQAAGLGGNPYRDGSYEYYLSEKVVSNDPKGVGAFLLASAELARLSGDGTAAAR